jgi:putative ABC transport system permease protein
MTMPIAMRLAIRQWLARPLRPVLCSLAIGAAVALIVLVGAAMDSLRISVSNAIGQSLGVAEVHVRPAQRGTDARVPGAVLQTIKALPEVELAGGRLSSQAMLIKGEDRLWFDVVGIEVPVDDTLRPKLFQAGQALTGQPDEILVDTLIAEKMALQAGDQIVYTIKDNPPKYLRIVGIVKRPVIEFISQPTMFVPLAVLMKDLGMAGEYSVLDLKLKERAGAAGVGEGIDFDQYAKDLGKKLGPAMEVTPGTNSKANMAEVERNMRLLLAMMSAVAAFSASLIIGTTLSVGVQERVRQFGQLRCLGASRGQLAIFLLGDAAVMLAIGLVIGIVLGVAVSAGLVAWFPLFFQKYALSGGTVLLALGCGVLATLLGALIPIWQVTRVPPMAAVTAVARPARRLHVWLAGAVGVLFLATQQLLWHLPASRDVRVLAYIFVGVHLIFMGWCLLAPPMVLLCERAGARVMAALFFVRPTLLRHAWSRTPWRAGAMIAALMIGVTTFTVVRARGHSIMTSFVAPRIPDLVVKSLFTGFTDQRLERLLREHPELRDVVPFDYFSARMTPPQSTIGKIAGDEQTTFVAVDMRKFAAQVALDYRQGDAATALKEMDEGRHIFVSTEFYNTRKLGKGDKALFKAADGTEVEFTIAAVVSSTGVDMVKNYFDLRASFGEKSISSVLGTVADGQKYFKLGAPSLLLINVTPAGREHMTALRDKLTGEGLQSLSAVEMKAALQNIVQRIIDGLSIIGIGALCLASLGVANMVIASIHSRRYEFGVLRAIGAGRWQLIRLVLAEVTLIGVIAGVLGAGAGLWYTYMISRVDREIIGLETYFIDPNARAATVYALLLVALAVGLTTLLGWVASLVPAIRGAMTAQRALLASGRG